MAELLDDTDSVAFLVPPYGFEGSVKPRPVGGFRWLLVGTVDAEVRLAGIAVFEEVGRSFLQLEVKEEGSSSDQSHSSSGTFHDR